MNRLVLSNRAIVEIAEALGNPPMVANGSYDLPDNCRVVDVNADEPGLSQEDIDRALRFDKLGVGASTNTSGE